MSIKPGYVTYFSVEVSVPKRERQYIGEIEMETDYEVGLNETNVLAFKQIKLLDCKTFLLTELSSKVISGSQLWVQKFA